MTPPELIAWHKSRARTSRQEDVANASKLTADLLRLLEDVMKEIERRGANPYARNIPYGGFLDRFNELFKEQGEQL